jgi:hypothetical protein
LPSRSDPGQSEAAIAGQEVILPGVLQDQLIACDEYCSLPSSCCDQKTVIGIPVLFAIFSAEPLLGPPLLPLAHTQICVFRRTAREPDRLEISIHFPVGINWCDEIGIADSVNHSGSAVYERDMRQLRDRYQLCNRTAVFGDDDFRPEALNFIH